MAEQVPIEIASPARRSTYRNALKYAFCPGCSHGRILDALDQALAALQWDPADVVIVTDIGCVGLSDQYLDTSAIHGLHGRSLTYATGVQLARPDLHVIVLIGDGGCGIGGAHLLNAARRNIGVTTLVFNNMNFGMTGGQHSVTTPEARITSTTLWGHMEHPLDIAETVARNGASYVWRGTAFSPDLPARIEEALRVEGFALLDIWELCVAYFAATNKVSSSELTTIMEGLGFRQGILEQRDQPEYTARQREALTAGSPASGAAPTALEPRYPTPQQRPWSIVLAGAAGAHIRTVGRFLGIAATLAGLWATQRDDYPVTVRSGHSLSEVIIAPEEILHTRVECPDLLFVLAEEGRAKAAATARSLSPAGRLFVLPEFAELQTPAQKTVFDPERFRGVRRTSLALAYVAAGVAEVGLLPKEALLEAAERISEAHAEANRQAVEIALQAI